MNNKWDKILLELSYRVSSGIPDLSNEQHLMKLWDILKEHNWNIDARVELLKNLDEQVKKRYYQTDKGQKAPEGAKVGVGPEGGTYYWSNPDGSAADEKDIPKEKPQDDEQPTGTKGEKETQEIRAIRTAIKKNKFDFENDTIEDIAKKTAKSEFKETDSKKASERAKETKRQVFEEGLSGKGGPKYRLQEEVSNLAKDVGFKNPDMSEQEIEDEVYRRIKEYNPGPKSALPKTEKGIRDLIKTSMGGVKTAKHIRENKAFDYNKEQPEGYPTTTTDGDVVRDHILTKYKEAKEAGDEELIKHYEKELKFFQKKASDKSITGTEGDADTIVQYYDNQGRLQTVYVTNKASEGDMLSNATIGTVTLSLEATIQPGADDKAVTRIAQEAMEQGQGFNNRYVRGSQKVIEDNREEFKKLDNIIAKASLTSDPRSDFHTNKPNTGAIKENLENPDVLKELEKQGMDIEEVKSNPEKFAKEIMQAGLDAHDSVETIGGGKNGVAYSTVKATKTTRSIRNKVDAELKRMGVEGEPTPEQIKEACDTVSKLKGGSKNKPLFNGQFSSDDIEQIYNSKALKQLEDEHVKRDRSMDDMYSETVRKLRETDLQYYMDEEGLSEEEALEKVQREAGPNERSYTAGFLKRTKLLDYISGDVDDKVISEMGTNSYTPKQVRQALADAIGFEGDTENPEEFLEYVLANVRANSEKQTLTFINKDNKEVTIGIDAHRLAGRNEKMAGQYGKDMVSSLKKIAAEDN
jgi:hypothetical protein